MTSAEQRNERPVFSVTAIGTIHRPGLADDATTAEGEYFDPFAESIVEIYPSGPAA